MFGYFIQDDGGHWYLIPEFEVEQFKNLLEDLFNCTNLEKCDDIAEHINTKFGEYRLSGGVESLKIPMSVIQK